MKESSFLVCTNIVNKIIALGDSMSKSTFSILIFTVLLLCIYFTTITVKYAHIGISVEETPNNQFEIINVVPKGAAEHFVINHPVCR